MSPPSARAALPPLVGFAYTLATAMNEIIPVRGLTNAEFLARHAAVGRVGLVGGNTLADRIIARAERHLHPTREWGRWTHAFVCQGARADGHQWVIESDLDIHRNHIRLGVQENRVAKFADDGAYSSLALIDFGLTPDEQARLLTAALELVANRARYSLRELLGTMLAMKFAGPRHEENRLAREHSYFCSALVRHVFSEAGVDLLPGLGVKHTTPEELARSPRPHRMWLLEREAPRPLLKSVAGKLRRVVATRRQARSPKATGQAG